MNEDDCIDLLNIPQWVKDLRSKHPDVYLAALELSA